MKKNIYLLKCLLLIVIPAVLIINLSFNNKTDFNFDPNYIYLFNGVNLAAYHGKLGHYDNPGTPVIESSAVVSRIIHAFRDTKDDFPTDVLKNPQYYVRMIAWIFSIVNTILLFFLGFFIYRASGQIAYGFVFQLIPYFSKTVFSWAFQLLSPEPLLLGASTVLVILFLRKYYFQKSFGYWQIKFLKKLNIESLDVFIVVFALLMGFLIATKLNSLPLLLLPLLFVPKFKNKFIFLIIAFVSFILFTLPIAKFYIMLLRWMASLFLRSGNYGTGNMEVVNFESVKTNFVSLISGEPVIFIVFSISVVLVVVKLLRKKFDLNFRIIGGLLLVQIAYLLMILKHFDLHYLVPIVPTFAINLFIIFQSLNLTKTMKMLIIVPLVSLVLWMNTDFSKAGVSNYPTIDNSAINIYSYNCNSPIYGLQYGNDYSLNANTPVLEKIYGKQYFYSIWEHFFTEWGDTITFESLRKQNKTLYLYMYEDYVKEWPTPFKMKLVSPGKFLIESDKLDSLANK